MSYQRMSQYLRDLKDTGKILEINLDGESRNVLAIDVDLPGNGRFIEYGSDPAFQSICEDLGVYFVSPKDNIIISVGDDSGHEMTYSQITSLGERIRFASIDNWLNYRLPKKASSSSHRNDQHL